MFCMSRKRSIGLRWARKNNNFREIIIFYVARRRSIGWTSRPTSIRTALSAQCSAVNTWPLSTNVRWARHAFWRETKSLSIVLLIVDTQGHWPLRCYTHTHTHTHTHTQTRQELLESSPDDRKQDEWYIEFMERFKRYTYIKDDIGYNQRESARARERERERERKRGTLDSWSVSKGIYILYNIGCTHAHTHTHTHTHTHAHTCVCVPHAQPQRFVSLCVCVCIHTYTFMMYIMCNIWYIHTFTFIYNVYVYVHV